MRKRTQNTLSFYTWYSYYKMGRYIGMTYGFGFPSVSPRPMYHCWLTSDDLCKNTKQSLALKNNKEQTCDATCWKLPYQSISSEILARFLFLSCNNELKKPWPIYARYEQMYGKYFRIFPLCPRLTMQLNAIQTPYTKPYASRCFKLVGIFTTMFKHMAFSPQPRMVKRNRAKYVASKIGPVWHMGPSVGPKCRFGHVGYWSPRR